MLTWEGAPGGFQAVPTAGYARRFSLGPRHTLMCKCLTVLKLCVAQRISCRLLRYTGMAELTREDFWVGGKHGSIPPKEQAKLYGILWCMETFGEHLKVKQDTLCEALTKVGGGSPGQPAVSRMMQAIKNDPEWNPGKSVDDADKRGPKRTVTEQKRQAVANAAMALKRPMPAPHSQPPPKDVPQGANQ